MIAPRYLRVVHFGTCPTPSTLTVSALALIPVFPFIIIIIIIIITMPTFSTERAAERVVKR